jgi:hypothetical protein
MRVVCARMNRSLPRQVILFGLLYYLVFLALDALIYLLSHVPPKAVDLNSLVLFLFDLERVLAGPKAFLRRLWPGESTPRYLNLLVTFLNCVVWGLGLAGLRRLWIKARK